MQSRCSHVAMILWYFGFARFQPSIDSTANFLAKYFENRSITEEDEDELQRFWLGEFGHYHIRMFGFIFNKFRIVFQESDADTFCCFRDTLEDPA